MSSIKVQLFVMPVVDEDGAAVAVTARPQDRNLALVGANFKPNKSLSARYRQYLEESTVTGPGPPLLHTQSCVLGRVDIDLEQTHS